MPPLFISTRNLAIRRMLFILINLHQIHCLHAHSYQMQLQKLCVDNVFYLSFRLLNIRGTLLEL